MTLLALSIVVVDAALIWTVYDNTDLIDTCGHQETHLKDSARLQN